MKLNVKLTLYTTVLACLTAGSLSIVSYHDMREAVDKDIDDSIIALVDTVYPTAAAAAYVENEDVANEVISGLTSNDIIKCVEIRKVTGDRMGGDDACDGQYTYKKALYSPFDSEEILGELSVFKDNSVIERKTNKRARYEARTIGITILLVVILVYFITYLSLTKPIQMLSNVLESFDFKSNTVSTLSTSNRKDEIGIISRVINALINNAEKRIKHEALLLKQTQLLTSNFKLTFELSKTAIAILDDNYSILSKNPAFRNLFTKEIDFNCRDFDKKWISYLFDDAELLATRLQACETLEKPDSIELSLCNQSYLQNPRHHYRVTFIKTLDELQQPNYLFFMDDITEHKRKLEATKKVADRDQLTQLLNRRAGQREISYLLSGKTDSDNVALMVLDLDGFKEVNDIHGHEAGDHVLVEVAKRLKSTMRSDDIISRWGGDEFVLAISNITEDQAHRVGKKIIASISKPMTFKDVELKVGVSIGAAISSEHSANFAELVDLADKAMYQVKRRGKNDVQVLVSKVDNTQ